MREEVTKKGVYSIGYFEKRFKLRQNPTRQNKTMMFIDVLTRQGELIDILAKYKGGVQELISL